MKQRARTWFFAGLLTAVFVVGFFVFFNPVFGQDTLGLDVVENEGDIALGSGDLRVTIVRIINIALGLLGIVALGIVLYGGFVWMTAGGNEEKVATARKILVNGTIGLVIILSAWTITWFVLSKLIEATGGGGGTTGGDRCTCAEPPESECRKTIECRNFCTRFPSQCCSTDHFIVKSITPSTPQTDQEIFMNNPVIRVVFSREVAGSPSDAFKIYKKEDGGVNRDVTQDFSFNFDGNDTIAEAEYVQGTVCGQHQGHDVHCLLAGEYEVKVGDVRDKDGNKLEVDTTCGNFPKDALFRTGDEAELAIDTQAPNLSQVTIDGGIIPNVRLVQGRTYPIATTLSDNRGNAYVHLNIYKEGDSGNKIRQHINGPAVSIGSSPAFPFLYGFKVPYTLEVGQTYVAEAVGNDIDNNTVTSQLTFRVIPVSCDNGELDPGETSPDVGGPCGGGDGDACRVDTDCSSWLKCLNPSNQFCSATDTTCVCRPWPYITDVEYMNGAQGNWITIFGRNFGYDPGLVTFDYPGGQRQTAPLAECRANDVWEDSWIIAEVPEQITPQAAKDPALELNGTDAYVSAPFNIFDWGFEDGYFSLEFWVKPPANGIIPHTLLAGTQEGGQFGIFTSSDDLGSVEAWVRDAGGEYNIVVGDPGQLLGNEWNHVVMTTQGVEGGSEVRLYINHNSLDKEPFTSQGAGFEYVEAEEFIIGFLGDDDYMRGAIDEVAVYAGVLTEAQIVEHYNAKNIGTIESYRTLVNAIAPRAYWTFSNFQSGDTQVTDISGNGFHGTYHGGIEAVSGPFISNTATVDKPSISVTTAGTGFTDNTDDDFGTRLPLFEYNSIQRPGLCSVTVPRDIVHTLADGTTVTTTAGSTKAPPDTPIEAVGKGFGNARGSLSFESTNAAVDSWSENLILSAVPIMQEQRKAVVRVTAPSGQVSNGIPFWVSSLADMYPPIIESISPSSTTKGSYITIKGKNFGNSGIVYFNTDEDIGCPGQGCFASASLPDYCEDTWNDNQIIAKVPTDGSFIFGNYHVVVVRDDNLKGVSKVVEKVTDGDPRPSICYLQPSSGPAPLPVGQYLTIKGENLDKNASGSEIYFWSPLSIAGDIATWLHTTTNDPGSSRVVEGKEIRAFIPVDTTAGFTMITGPIVVKPIASNVVSNEMIYNVRDCREFGTGSLVGFQCCQEGREAGRWKSNAFVCEGGRREAGYAWRFTSGKIPDRFFVLEQCQDGTIVPSPSPWANRPQGNSACLNAEIDLVFSLPVKKSSIGTGTDFEEGLDGSNIKVETCGSGQQIDCSASADVTSEFRPAFTETSVAIARYRDQDGGNIDTLTPNTWHRVSLKETVTSAHSENILGVQEERNENLVATRPCESNDGSSFAFCFEFKTGAPGTICTLKDALIDPPRKTTNLLGVVQDDAFPRMYDITRIFNPGTPGLNPLYYMVRGVANQECTTINVDSKPWIWGPTDPPVTGSVPATSEKRARGRYVNSRGIAKAWEDWPQGYNIFATTPENVSSTIVVSRESDTIERLTKLPDPTIIPAGFGRSVEFSPDGNYLAVGHDVAPFISMYRRNGDTFTKLDIPSGPTQWIVSMDFSSDGVYLAVLQQIPPFVTMYKRNGDTFTKLATPSPSNWSGSSRGWTIDFSPDTNYLAIAQETSPYITIYHRSGDTFSRANDPDILPTGSGKGVTFSPDGNYMATSFAVSPYLTVYKRNGDAFVKLENPSPLPTDGARGGIAFSPDSNYLVLTTHGSTNIMFYKRNGDAFTRIADNVDQLPLLGFRVDFSPDGSYVVVSHGSFSSTPFFSFYRRDNDAITKINTFVPSTPVNGASDVAFSPNSQYVAVAHTITPFLSIYKIAYRMGASTVETFDTTVITATSTLHIDLTHPQVVSKWPSCIEACVNAEIGAQFNQIMDKTTFTTDNVHLYRCSDETCTVTSTASISPGSHDDNILRFYPQGLLTSSTWYLVELTSGIKGVSGVDPSGRALQDNRGKSIERTTWKFRTKPSSEPCVVDTVDVRPDPFTATFIGQRQRYSAVPKGAPDSCNPRGQFLNPWDYGWNWYVRDSAVASSNSTIATTTNFGFSGNINRACGLNCIPTGSDVPQGTYTGVYPVCGNGRVELGEDCDIASTTPSGANENHGISCAYNCLRLGNSNKGNGANQCGNGVVEEIRGEECDPNNLDSNFVPYKLFCTDTCVWTGSSVEATGNPTTPICGSGSVTPGEDCDGTLGCSTRCLNTGTPLSQAWCDTHKNDNDKTYELCPYATSVCGNDIVENGEECDPIGNQSVAYCTDRCLLVNVCNEPTKKQCDPEDDEGCSPDCTWAGSSIEYSTPSLCGDGQVGIGEYAGCEITPDEARSQLGGNPVQLVTAIGEPPAGASSVVPLDSLETFVFADPERIRFSPASIGNVTSTIRGQGDYELQCGYTENISSGQDIGSTTVVFEEFASNHDMFVLDKADDGIYVLDVLLNDFGQQLDILSVAASDELVKVSVITEDEIEKLHVEVPAEITQVNLEYEVKDIATGEQESAQVALHIHNDVANVFRSIVFDNFDLDDFKEGDVVAIHVDKLDTFRVPPGIDPYTITEVSDVSSIVGSLLPNVQLDISLLPGHEVFDITESSGTAGILSFDFSAKRGDDTFTGKIFINIKRKRVVASETIEQTQSVYNDCSPNPGNIYGVAKNSCCVLRPERVDQYPAANAGIDGSEPVCRNTYLEVSFDKFMDSTSFDRGSYKVNDLVRFFDNAYVVEGYEVAAYPNFNCESQGMVDVSEDMSRLTGSIAPTGHVSFLKKIWNSIKLFFVRLFTGDVFAVDENNQLTGRTIRWCYSNNTLDPRVRYELNETGVVSTSTAALYLDNALPPNVYVAVMLRGGQDGVRDINGVGIKNPHSTSRTDFWMFKTGSEICKIDSVSVDPATQMYQEPGDEHTFHAQVLSKRAQQIVSTPAYVWEYIWHPQNPVFDIPKVTTPPTSPNTPDITIQNKGVEGLINAIAEVKVTYDADSEDNHTGKKFNGLFELNAFFCANPWPSTGEYFQDDYYNFRTRYCADAENPLYDFDDLPLLQTGINPSEAITASGTLEKVLFFNPKNDDVIGIQIFLNPPDELTGLRRTLGDWYSDRFEDLGNMRRVSVDGNEALTDGRNYYVNAYNVTSTGMYNNVYLFSINEGAQPETQKVFDQIIASLQFNTNLRDINKCLDADGDLRGSSSERISIANPEIDCTTDIDCINDNGQAKLNVHPSGICANEKTKFFRDIKRLEDLKITQSKLDGYFAGNVFGADFKADLQGGSYIPGYTNSRWLSWGTLAGLVNGLTVDPINDWRGCSPNDSLTCWNAASSTFRCPQFAQVYEYAFVSTTLGYNIYAPFEYMDASDDIVEQFVDTSRIRLGQRWCTPATVYTPFQGTCGDGILNPSSEQCEPPGRERVTYQVVDGGRTSSCPAGQFATSTCSQTCQWTYSACHVAAQNCGDGEIQGSEACDDGNKNGTYGYCNSTCLDLHPEYCGDNVYQSGKEFCERVAEVSVAFPIAGKKVRLNLGESMANLESMNATDFLNTYCSHYETDFERGICNVLFVLVYTYVDRFVNDIDNFNYRCSGDSTLICNPDEGLGPSNPNAGCRAPSATAMAYLDNLDINDVVTNVATTTLNDYGYCREYALGNFGTPYNHERDLTCSWNCQSYGAYCGDGVRQPQYEQCDDGNTNDRDACTNDCMVHVNPDLCGNGSVDVGEQCDDGNTINSDSCLNSCVIRTDEPRCGDGERQPEIGEECDLANQNGVACSANGYNEKCVYCSLDCKSITVESAKKCGNGRIDYDAQNRPYEKCDFVQSGGRQTRIFTTSTPPNSRETTCVDQLGPVEYPDFNEVRGSLKCSPDCLTLDTSDCVECGVRKFVNGAQTPYISVINVLTGKDTRNGVWGSETHLGLYSNRTSGRQYVASRNLGATPYNPQRIAYGNGLSDMSDDEDDPVAGIDTNVKCNKYTDVQSNTFEHYYQLYFNSGRTGTDRVRGGTYFDYIVNNETTNIERELFVSPALPTSMLRIAVRASRENQPSDARFVGGFYADGIGQVLYPVGSAGVGVRCRMIEQGAQEYWLPSAGCNTVLNNIWIHDLVNTDSNRVQSFTFSDGIFELLQPDKPVAFYVQALEGPIYQFKNYDVWVEIYEYHEGQNPAYSIYAPTRTFYLNRTGSSSTNQSARYWHVFTLRKQGTQYVVETPGGENGSIETDMCRIRANMPNTTQCTTGRT
ncbi:MAG: LamG-like jellyroll fold domain-containing protein [Candidatus Magasanikbacteria bacterium]